MNNADKPAYPQLHMIDGNWIDEPKEKYAGLTKREKFAMAAMQGLCSRAHDFADPKELARYSVEQADELLKQLEETQ